jgi:hypothetical protein
MCMYVGVYVACMDVIYICMYVYGMYVSVSAVSTDVCMYVSN